MGGYENLQQTSQRSEERSRQERMPLNQIQQNNEQTLGKLTIFR